MRSISRSTKVAAGLALAIGLLAGLALRPAYRFAMAAAYQHQYGELVFKCDQAMREHFIAKARAGAEPSDQHAALLAESEVALIDCQDYDMLRKRLLRLGLADDDLAAMGLVAIEERGKDIREIVRIHEIRY